LIFEFSEDEVGYYARLKISHCLIVGLLFSLVYLNYLTMNLGGLTFIISENSFDTILHKLGW